MTPGVLAWAVSLIGSTGSLHEVIAQHNHGTPIIKNSLDQMIADSRNRESKEEFTLGPSPLAYLNTLSLYLLADQCGFALETAICNTLVPSVILISQA